MSALPYTDALAYYDRDIDVKQGVRAAVEQEIEDEKRRFEPGAYLSPAAALFSNNPELAAELERVARGEKASALDTNRHQLSAPEAFDDESWAQALDNAAVQQEAMGAVEQHAADDISEETDHLNRARRDAQLRVGERLSTLENRWGALVSKNLSLSAANLTARADISALSQRKLELEAELAHLDADA